MKEGDKIIWDSGFGYDIAQFVKKSLAHESCSIIVLRSGNFRNRQMLVTTSELKPYSNDLAGEFSKKYLCDLKSFNN